MTTEIPVLVVGGGMSGLTTSLHLARHGIKTLTIERHPSTSHLPKAHTVNNRSMEIFRQLGIVEQFKEKATPPENIQTASWRTSFGGTQPYEGKILVTVDAFSGGATRAQYEAASPEPYASYHQVILEPFLVSILQDEPLVDLRFETEIVDFTEDAEGITATIRDLSTGETDDVRAQYVVAADGGKFFQPRLGYDLRGVRGLGDNVSLWLKMDLSKWMDDGSLLSWFVTPNSFGMASGVLVPVGVGSKSQEWVLHFGYPDGGGASVTEAEAIQRMKDLFKIPDLEFELIKMSKWSSEQVLADRFRTGRVIGTGDAIHKHPPTLGIGMNSAIGDSHNLAWKLAHVIKGYSPDALLDTFQEERHPVLARNGENALLTYFLHVMMVPALGMVPGAPTDWNVEALNRFVEDSPLGRDRRARATELTYQNQRIEHQALDLEIGYRYRGAGILIEPDDEWVPDPMLNAYIPSTAPGARLAHAWLTAPDGSKVSTLDLLGLDYTLIVPRADSPWVAAAQTVAADARVPLTVAVIGEGGYLDAEGMWSETAQIGTDGALLVRPDQHVAWRARGAVQDPAAEFASLFRAVTLSA